MASFLLYIAKYFFLSITKSIFRYSITYILLVCFCSILKGENQKTLIIFSAQKKKRSYIYFKEKEEEKLDS